MEVNILVRIPIVEYYVIPYIYFARRQVRLPDQLYFPFPFRFQVAAAYYPSYIYRGKFLV